MQQHRAWSQPEHRYHTPLHCYHPSSSTHCAASRDILPPDAALQLGGHVTEGTLVLARAVHQRYVALQVTTLQERSRTGGAPVRPTLWRSGSIVTNMAQCKNVLCLPT